MRWWDQGFCGEEVGRVDLVVMTFGADILINASRLRGCLVLVRLAYSVFWLRWDVFALRFAGFRAWRLEHGDYTIASRHAVCLMSVLLVVPWFERLVRDWVRGSSSSEKLDIP